MLLERNADENPHSPILVVIFPISIGIFIIPSLFFLLVSTKMLFFFEPYSNILLVFELLAPFIYTFLLLDTITCII